MQITLSSINEFLSLQFTITATTSDIDLLPGAVSYNLRLLLQSNDPCSRNCASFISTTKKKMDDRDIRYLEER